VAVSYTHLDVYKRQTATFLTVSAFLPEMVARRSGVIITMSSAAARQAARSSAAYAAAKGGVVAFTRHLANELGKDGIRVNCLAPSAIENDKMRSWVPEDQREACLLYTSRCV